MAVVDPIIAGVAVTAAGLGAGGLVGWGVFKRMMAEFDRRLERGDARFKKQDEDAIEAAREAGRNEVRLANVEKTAAKVDEVRDELIEFRTEARLGHEAHGSCLEKIQFTLQGMQRQLADVVVHSRAGPATGVPGLIELPSNTPAAHRRRGSRG